MFTQKQPVMTQATPDLVHLSESAPSIPRYLQLARAIHNHFTSEEDKEMAVLKQAQELAALKNEAIMRSVNEVLEFCEILRKVPALKEVLDRKIDDIKQRLLSDKCTYTVEDETIAVEYKAPFYQVDMHMPEHISLANVDDAYLQISFNPVRFVVTRNGTEENSTVTKHLLMKQYRLDANGTFLHFTGKDGTAADPIADIITELRAKIGREFFESSLMPSLEREAAHPDGEDI